jgi:hypothetical protein
MSEDDRLKNLWNAASDAQKAKALAFAAIAPAPVTVAGFLLVGFCAGPLILFNGFGAYFGMLGGLGYRHVRALEAALEGMVNLPRPVSYSEPMDTP